MIGFNEYFGWYYLPFVANLSASEADIRRSCSGDIMPRIPLQQRICQAHGHRVRRRFQGGFRSPEALLWSEYQARVYARCATGHAAEQLHWSRVCRPALQGATLAALRPLNGVQEFYNRGAGLVDERGQSQARFRCSAAVLPVPATGVRGQ